MKTVELGSVTEPHSQGLRLETPSTWTGSINCGLQQEEGVNELIQAEEGTGSLTRYQDGLLGLGIVPEYMDASI